MASSSLEIALNDTATDSSKATESRNPGFWIALATIQVIVGLGIFALTRHYYMRQTVELPARTSSVAFPAPVPQAFQGNLASPQATLPSSTPQTPEAIAERADERFQARDYAAAAALYEQLLALDPTNVSLMNNLGITLHYLGRSEEALQQISNGLDIDSAHQRSWLTLGFIHSQLGNADEARAALTNAVRLGADTEVGQSATRMLSDLGLQ
jgi:tetratricopeptide (TPR) repeat protein